MAMIRKAEVTRSAWIVFGIWVSILICGLWLAGCATVSDVEVLEREHQQHVRGLALAMERHQRETEVQAEAMRLRLDALEKATVCRDSEDASACHLEGFK